MTPESKAETTNSPEPDLSDPEITFVAKVVSEATVNGRIIYAPKNIHLCPVCDKNAGYPKYSRSGRWQRRGDTNYDRPLTFSGCELAHRLMSIRGYATLGCCAGCFIKLRPHLAMALAGIRAEVSEQVGGCAPKWKWSRRMACTVCDWSGLEADMGLLPTMMPGGKYYGECPSCHARNMPFRPLLIVAGAGWDVVECK